MRGDLRMSEIHLKIRGEVQGVGFRHAILQKAQKLGLHGWARNVPDGSVEVLAQGPKPALEKFLAWARIGPAGAKVERIEEFWQEASPS